MERPTSLTVIAVLGLLFGGLGLLCCGPLTLIGTVSMLAGQEPEPVFGMVVELSTFELLLQGLSSGIGLIASGLIFFGSITAFMNKPNSVTLLRYGAWLVLASNIPYFFSQIGQGAQGVQMSGANLPEEAALAIGVVVAAMGACLFSIYPIAVLLVLRSQSVTQFIAYTEYPAAYQQQVGYGAHPQYPQPPQYPGAPQQPPHPGYPPQQGGYPPQQGGYPPPQGPSWYQPPPEDDPDKRNNR